MDWIPGSEPQSEWSRMRSVLMSGAIGSPRVRQSTYSAVVASSPQAQFVKVGRICPSILFVAAVCYICYMYWERIKLALKEVKCWLTKSHVKWVTFVEKPERIPRKRRRSPLLIKVKRLELRVTDVKRVLGGHVSLPLNSRPCSPPQCSDVLKTKTPQESSCSASEWETS